MGQPVGFQGVGVSIGDYLSQPATHGGLGLGTTVTSMIFVGAVIAVVIRPNGDGTPVGGRLSVGRPERVRHHQPGLSGHAQRRRPGGGHARIGDLEYGWDNDQARLKPKDAAAWTEVDGRIDTVLRELRAANPNTGQEQSALTALLAVLGQQPAPRPWAAERPAVDDLLAGTSVGIRVVVSVRMSVALIDQWGCSPGRRATADAVRSSAAPAATGREPSGDSWPP